MPTLTAIGGTLTAEHGSLQGSTVTPPEAPSYTAQHLSDLNGLVVSTAYGSNGWVQPAVAIPGLVEETSTPHGPGFHVYCGDLDRPAWYSDAPGGRIKATILQLPPSAVQMGRAERWEFWAYFPTQTIYWTWHDGLFWEYHTSTNSGNCFNLSTKTWSNSTTETYPPGFRLTRDHGDPILYFYTPDGVNGGTYPNLFDTWHHFRHDIKWSQGADGFDRRWINGVQYVNDSGPSYRVDATAPYLQFGFYSDTAAGANTDGPTTTAAPVTNEVIFGGIQMTVLS